MKSMLLAAVLLVGMTSFANGPQVEPGPLQELNAESTEAMTALLMAKPSDIVKFIKAGNSVKSASIKRQAPEATVYYFTRQDCGVGGIAAPVCIEKAILTVQLTQVHMGTITKIVANSQVTYIRQ